MENYFVDEIGVDQFDRNHFILFDSGGYSINDLLAELGIIESCSRNFKLRTPESASDSLDSTTPSSIANSSNQESHQNLIKIFQKRINQLSKLSFFNLSD